MERTVIISAFQLSAEGEFQFSCPHCQKPYPAGNSIILALSKECRIVGFLGQSKNCCSHIIGLMPRIFINNEQAVAYAFVIARHIVEYDEFFDSDVKSFKTMLDKIAPGSFAELEIIASRLFG